MDLKGLFTGHNVKLILEYETVKITPRCFHVRISYILPIHIYIYIYVPVYTYKQLKQNLFYDDIKMAPDLGLSSVEWANN